MKRVTAVFVLQVAASAFIGVMTNVMTFGIYNLFKQSRLTEYGYNLVNNTAITSGYTAMFVSLVWMFSVTIYNRRRYMRSGR